jgi:predicted transport protein
MIPAAAGDDIQTQFEAFVKGQDVAKTPEEATQTMIENLKKNTGKSLDQWVKIAQSSKLAKHGEIVKFLKDEHELGHGYANLVAMKSLGTLSSDESTDDLLAGQYAGAKAGLRPIYDALAAEIGKFGKDVDFSAKKAYVSLRRSKQFGIIQPSTATRVDVGINLKGEKVTDRLEASGSFNAMVSHRVRIENKAQVDKELIGWLKKAYDAS